MPLILVGYDETLAVGPSSWYAYVTFYSTFAAKQVKLKIYDDQKLVDLNVLFKTCAIILLSRFALS